MQAHAAAAAAGEWADGAGAECSATTQTSAEGRPTRQAPCTNSAPGSRRRSSASGAHQQQQQQRPRAATTTATTAPAMAKVKTVLARWQRHLKTWAQAPVLR
eukprot:m51a1_g10487 hypothetical protein (102) ;mRNA; r:53844-54149